MTLQPQISTTRCYARIAIVSKDLRSVQIVIACKETNGRKDDVGPVNYMIFETHKVDQRSLLGGSFRRT